MITAMSQMKFIFMKSEINNFKLIRFSLQFFSFFFFSVEHKVDINLSKDTDTFKDNLFKEVVAQLADPSITRKKALSIVRNIHAIHANVLKSLLQYTIAKNITDDESRRTLEILCGASKGFAHACVNI